MKLNDIWICLGLPMVLFVIPKPLSVGYLACLCAGDSGRVACRVMRLPLCPPFVVARFALRLCIADSATVT